MYTSNKIACPNGLSPFFSISTIIMIILLDTRLTQALSFQTFYRNAFIWTATFSILSLFIWEINKMAFLYERGLIYFCSEKSLYLPSTYLLTYETLSLSLFLDLNIYIFMIIPTAVYAYQWTDLVIYILEGTCYYRYFYDWTPSVCALELHRN